MDGATEPRANRQWDIRRQHLTAAVVGATMILLSGGSYFAVMQAEAMNPRRRGLESAWPSISVGMSAADVFARLGAPDEACPSEESVVHGPCYPLLSGSGRVCAREYSWYPWPQQRSGEYFAVCVDSSGAVVRKERPWMLVTP